LRNGWDRAALIRLWNEGQKTSKKGPVKLWSDSLQAGENARVRRGSQFHSIWETVGCLESVPNALNRKRLIAHTVSQFHSPAFECIGGWGPPGSGCGRLRRDLPAGPKLQLGLAPRLQPHIHFTGSVIPRQQLLRGGGVATGIQLP